MDGLDLILARFQMSGDDWVFDIDKSKTVEYGESIFDLLSNSNKQSKKNLKNADLVFGEWIGEAINAFTTSYQIDLNAIHGHTAIHSPKQNISLQLGNGSIIAEITNNPTVTEFRSLDVSLGGEGAPLVPFGDFQLFSDYDVCLNLGGIANLSIRDSRSAWDICPCNQVLNYYSNKLGMPFDSGGAIAKRGKLNRDFLEQIKAIDYFTKIPPKSLPNQFIPATTLDMVKPEEGLRSYTELIASQISYDLKASGIKAGKMLVTGGGAFNSFLISEIRNHLPQWEVVVPDDVLVNYKEALIFAFLGLKRSLNEINVLRSVTGGSKDTSSGVIHLPK